MTDYRRDPATGQLAQRLAVAADYGTGEPVPDSVGWVVLFFQPGSGLQLRHLDDAEAETWTPVRIVEVNDA